MNFNDYKPCPKCQNTKRKKKCDVCNGVGFICEVKKEKILEAFKAEEKKDTLQ